MVVSETSRIEVFEKEKNQPIHQWVYQVLRTNIIELHLRPSQQISENELSEILGTSRTPVREAFIRLAEDGLVQVTPQKRSIISPIDLEQAEEARFIRRAMEKAVMREACAGFPDSDRADLLSNIELQLDCQRTMDYDRMLIVDNDFHRTIFRGCRKERSWLFIKKLDYNYDRLRTMVMPRVLEKIIAEHRSIVETIAGGKIDAIDDIVERHLTWVVIDTVVHEYPPEYFKQDPSSGLDRAAPAARPAGAR